MYVDGTNICIKTRTPTQEELDCCNHIHLTLDRECKPNNVKLPEVVAVRRDVDAFHGDNAEDSVPGEMVHRCSRADQGDRKRHRPTKNDINLCCLMILSITTY
jgi:hypothetical protein